MAIDLDLRLVAERIADLGPGAVLTEPTMSALSELTDRSDVVDAVAVEVGTAARATEWLHGLRQRAAGAVADPDGDHALLVGGLSALGAVVAHERPEQATVAFEAVALR